MAVCISHQKIMSFFGSLKQIWLLSSTNLEFFRFTHTAYFVHLKNSRFVDSRSQILISFTEKTQDFLFEMQTAIIAHQWKSKFSQFTANPAGLQRKTDRKMEKPIALRAHSFFPWAKLLVLNFVERKDHFCVSDFLKRKCYHFTNFNIPFKIIDTISDRKNTIKPIKQSEESTLFCMHPAVQPECMNQNKPRVARIFHFWLLL